MKKISILFAFVVLLIIAAAHPPPPFNNDSMWRIYDNNDVTKRLCFEANSISADTTRTITMPDADVDLGNFTGNVNDVNLANIQATCEDDFHNIGGVDADTTYSDLSEFNDDIGVSDDYDEYSDLPTAAVTDGDNTHVSSADSIHDFVIGLGYLAEESDPCFTASDACEVTAAKIATWDDADADLDANCANWDTAYDWGEGDDDLSDDDLDALQNVAALTETTGDILYWTGSAWDVLGIGAEGKVLEVSAGGIPEWDTDDTGGGGEGDVTGPGPSVVSGDLAIFDGTGGYAITNSGFNIYLDGMTLPTGGAILADSASYFKVSGYTGYPSLILDTAGGNTQGRIQWSVGSDIYAFITADNTPNLILSADDQIFLQPNNNEDDYIALSTTLGVPRISTVGGCNLEIQSDGGEVCLGPCDLMTNGTITAATIGAFQATGAINFGSENMTNVDIDSGTLDGVALGATCTQTEWDAAYGWGDHADLYLAIDHDACEVTAAKITAWDDADSDLDANYANWNDTADDLDANSADWDAAYAHISSNGSDHSWINQNVTTLGTPTFEDVTTTHDLELTGGTDADIWFRDGATEKGNIAYNGTDMLFTSASGTIDFSNENLTTLGDVTCDELTLTVPTQDFKFIGIGSALGIQNQTSGQNSRIQLYSYLGNATDTIDLRFVAYGLPTDYNPYSVMDIGYYVPSDIYYLRAYKGGTGDAGSKNLHIWTESNTSQLVLETDGDIVMATLPTGTGTALEIDGSNRIVRNTSTMRDKENIRPLTDGHKLYDLLPRIYDRKDSEVDNQFGFIAEEVNEVDPNLINLEYEPVFEEFYEIDPAGNNVLYKKIVGYRKTGRVESVRWKPILALAIVEMQKLRAEIDELQVRVATLEKISPTK